MSPHASLAVAYCPDEPLARVSGWSWVTSDTGGVLQRVSVQGSSCEVSTVYRDQYAFMENVERGRARVALTTGEGWLVLVSPPSETPALVRREVELRPYGDG